MDTTGILRPDELPFEVPYDLQASARSVSEENDAWVRWYYVQYGWRHGHD